MDQDISISASQCRNRAGRSTPKNAIIREEHPGILYALYPTSVTIWPLPKFSPDGRYLTYGHVYGADDEGYELIDMVAGTHRRLIPPGGGDFGWAHDSLRYAYNTLAPFDHRFYVSSLYNKTGEALLNTTVSFRWLRSGQYLVVEQNVNNVGSLYRVAADGSDITPIKADDTVVQLLDVLPDDRVLYLQEYMPGNDLFIINADGTGKTQITNDPTTSKAWFYVSPNQGLITYQVYASSTSPTVDSALFFVLNAKGEVVSTIQNRCRPQDLCFVTSLTWTSDESAIYYTVQYLSAPTASADIFRSDLTDNPIPVLVRKNVTPRGTIALSPDGRYLAYTVPSVTTQSSLVFRDLLTNTETVIATGDGLVFRGWRPQP